MFKNLRLVRPLAVLDLETTGTDAQKDRIVEISILKVLPNDHAEHCTRRVNPGMLIPPVATAIHGITTEDVAGEPRFNELAPALLGFLDCCDLCGFNIKRFDLRMLYAEFSRAGLSMSLAGRAVIDPLEIFHTYEPRDLAAAVRLYCGHAHDQHHAARTDVLATARVLDAMIARYPDLPCSVPELFERFKDQNAVDVAGCFSRVTDEVRFRFGKFRGQPLDEIAQSNPDYLEWMLTQDFFADVKTLVRDALRKRRPQGPGTGQRRHLARSL
jgi:DNA polymerase-3 subunit epsilon